MEVAVLKCKRHLESKDPGAVYWKEVIKHLEKRGLSYSPEPIEADLSIVLCGKFENPAVVKGRKVLAFKPQEWLASVLNPPKGWMLYQPVLENYYDDFINLAGLGPKKAAKEIVKYARANALDKPRSAD